MQWLDVVWSILVLLGIEKLRIVPGITEANAYDLYYMPYTHGLPGALALSLLFGAVVAILIAEKRATAFVVVSLVAFSHGFSTSSSIFPISRFMTTPPKSASAYGGMWP